MKQSNKKSAKTLVLDLNNWRCGQESENSYGYGQTELENHQGFMCCLGQFSKQIEPKICVIGVGEPEDVFYNCENILVTKTTTDDYIADDDTNDSKYSNTRFSEKCIQINDSISTNVTQKIKQLTQQCKTIGYTLRVRNDKMFDSRGRLINITPLFNQVCHHMVEDFINGEVTVKEFAELFSG